MGFQNWLASDIETGKFSASRLPQNSKSTLVTLHAPEQWRSFQDAVPTGTRIPRAAASGNLQGLPFARRSVVGKVDPLQEAKLLIMDFGLAWDVTGKSWRRRDYLGSTHIRNHDPSPCTGTRVSLRFDTPEVLQRSSHAWRTPTRTFDSKMF